MSILVQSTGLLFYLSPKAFAEEGTSSGSVESPIINPTPVIDTTPTPAPDSVIPTPEVLVTPTDTAAPVPSENPADTVTSTPTTVDNLSPPSSDNPSTGGQNQPSDTASPVPTSIETSNASSGNETLSAVILKDNFLPVDILNLANTVSQQSATLTTDKEDYAPTEVVVITGSGFDANTTYTLVITSSDEPPVNFQTYVKADENGGFLYTYQLDGNYRPNYGAKLLDLNGNIIASTFFTDAAPTLNITRSGAGGGTVTSNDGFINCVASGGSTSGTCSHTYGENNPGVILTAVADSSSSFDGWTGGTCAGTGTCVPSGLTGNNEVTVEAIFNEVTTVQILGFKYFDVDQSGSYDGDDYPLENWTLCLNPDGNNQGYPVSPSNCQNTDANGFVEWTVPVGSEYDSGNFGAYHGLFMQESNQGGWINTFPPNGGFNVDISFNQRGEVIYRYYDGESHNVDVARFGNWQSTDATPPTVESAETQDTDDNGKIDTIKLTFSENIDDSMLSEGDADGWDVQGDYSGEAIGTGDNENDNVLLLTFSESGNLDTGATPDVSYSSSEDEDTSTHDLAGNELASNEWSSDDGAAPISSITFPEEDAGYTEDEWGGEIQGTAEDSPSTGINSVLVSIQRDTDSAYWDADEEEWVIGQEEEEYPNEVEFDEETGEWIFPFAFIDPEGADEGYTVRSHAIDNAQNQENTTEVHFFFERAPIISGETESSVSLSSVTITWDTDFEATSRVVYDTVSHAVLGVSPNYGYANSTVEADTDPKVTSHSVSISGLTAGTTYFYRTISHGSPEAVSDENSFTTSSPAPIPTPTSEPTSTSSGEGGGDGKSDGLGCASHDCSGGKQVSQNQVLDVSNEQIMGQVLGEATPEATLSPKPTQEVLGEEEKISSKKNQETRIKSILSARNLIGSAIVLFIIILLLLFFKRKKSKNQS